MRDLYVIVISLFVCPLLFVSQIPAVALFQNQIKRKAARHPVGPINRRLKRPVSKLSTSLCINFSPHLWRCSEIAFPLVLSKLISLRFCIPTRSCFPLNCVASLLFVYPHRLCAHLSYLSCLNSQTSVFAPSPTYGRIYSSETFGRDQHVGLPELAICFLTCSTDLWCASRGTFVCSLLAFC